MAIRCFLYFSLCMLFPSVGWGQCQPTLNWSPYFCNDSNSIWLSSPVLSIEWSTADGAFHVNPLFPAQIIVDTPGTYCAVSVDLLGCTDTTCLTMFEPFIDIDITPSGCCSGAETYGLSANVQTNFPYSDMVFRWEKLNVGNVWEDVIDDAFFSGANTETLQIANCGSYNGIYFRLRVTVSGCGSFYSSPFLAGCSDDLDGDGYENSNDLDELNPCVPDYCAPTCDYDFDTLPNNLDEDNDDDGCIDEFDESDCDAANNSLTISSSSLCPVGGATCDQVCEFSTVTYSVENPEGRPVIWKVTGAESYTRLGNEVLVNWGSEGLGQVEVSMPVPCDNFFVTCGQFAPAVLDSMIPMGKFFLSVLKGCPSQTIYRSLYNSNSWSQFNIGVSGFDAEGFTNFTYFFPFNVLLINAPISSYYKIDDDHIRECYHRVYSEDEPNVAINIKSLKQPYDCSDCVGKIEYEVYSTMPLASTILTNISTGEILNNLDNLCPGIYSIKATDITGFTKTEEVIVSCGEDNTCGKNGTLCVEIKPSPQAIVQTVPAALNNTLELCKGETVLFTNNSMNATQAEWDFGDGATSVQGEVVHGFSTPGIYQVSLLARNGCACYDTTNLTVVVSNEEIPDIQCIGSVCQGDSATYRSNVVCSDYQWSLSPNGQTISGGSPTDDFVTVLWPTGSTGYVELAVTGCTGSICPKPIRKQVSILGGTAAILGPAIVCPNSLADYSIPDLQGASIEWSVTGAGNAILEGQGTNRVKVQWGEIGGTVSVQYDNCFLECGGEGQKTVEVKSPTYLDGPVEICSGDAPIFRHKSLIDNTLSDASWEILNAVGTLVWTSNGPIGSISPSWDFAPGQYTVRAIPLSNGGSCSAETGLSVHLFGIPPAPIIGGATEVCPTNLYTYSASSSLPNASFEWEIINGNNTLVKTGQPIIVKWGNNQPYQLTLWQTDAAGPGCTSPPASLEIQPFSTVGITGPNSLCKGAIATYEAEYLPEVDFQWTVEPASAGVVLTGQGSPSVSVFWQKAGTAVLKLSACGAQTDFPVSIDQPVSPQILGPDPVCPNESAQVQVLGAYTSYKWKNVNGQIVSTAASPLLESGYYLLETEDAVGCVATAPLFIEELPTTNAQILAANTDLCLGPASLLALQTADGLNYQWYRSGDAVGANSSILSADQPGNYWVVVSAANGCTASSNHVLLLPCDTTSTPGGGGGGNSDPSQGGGGGTPCLSVAEPSFDVQFLGDCSQLHLVNTSTLYDPDSLAWALFDQNGNLLEMAHGETADFTLPSNGFYEIGFTTLVPLQANPGLWCSASETQLVNNTLDPKFKYQATCVGLPTQFTDLSSYMPALVITGWQWDFGDPTSGALNQSTQQHPAHIYSQTGTYPVTLTVTTSTGCQKSYTLAVTVQDPPTVSFAPPSANCEAIALNFAAVGGNGAVTYAWDFGDPNSGNANNSQSQSTWHTYPSIGTYNVTVTAANIYGCTANYSSNVSIQANNLTGDISPSEPAPSCEGQPILLTAPSGGSSWYWSNGATTSSINAVLAGIYSVTMTDGLGCIYKPSPVVVEVIEGPVATIRAVELNEFGQPVAYHPQSYTACEGEEVYLEMNGQPKYTYLWSDGSTGEQLIFTEASGGILPTGLQSFTVTVTDIITGCTSVEGPFPVTVQGAPASVAINSTPLGPLCDGTVASFSVVNPQAGYAYVWNTGDAGVSMTAAAAGSYLVQATNQFGCTAKSNAIEIHNAPHLGSLPSGCYTRCNPTEICLPEMPEVVQYQWFLNGAAIPLPEGGVPNFEATENGDYQVQMTSTYGCVSLSGLLSLDLMAAFGHIAGTVWLDENNNGMIDPADLPLPGIGVLLSQNGAWLDTLLANGNGAFDFGQIPSTTYSAQLDTANLPVNLEPIIWDLAAVLEGCDDSTTLQFLVKDWCATPLSDTLQLGACTGDSVVYNGVYLPAGTGQSFHFTSFHSCDSTVVVNAMAFPLDFQSVQLTTCPGEPVIYNGQSLLSGDSLLLIYQNQFGCDSTIAVAVDAFQTAVPTLMEVTVCPGDSLLYEDQVLWPGEVQDFTLQDQNGCDSLVNLTVSAYPQIAVELGTAPICPKTKDGAITINFQAGDGPFSTLLNGVNYANAASMEGLAAGFYVLEISDVHGCQLVQNIEIQELAPLEVAVEDYVLPCDEAFVTLRPTVLSYTGSLTWEWPDASHKAWFQAKQSGSYMVHVADDCSSVEVPISVAWGDNAPDEPFYVPNAFSPNADGINDLFQVYPAYGTVFLDFECTVFNRWGDMLYNSHDAEIGWDGSFRGKPTDTGVYTWFVQAKMVVCGREVDIFREGDVTLLR